MDEASTTAIPASKPRGGMLRRLGEILLETGRLTETQLRQALELQESKSQRLGELLVELGFLEPDHVQLALCQQARIETVDLDVTAPDVEAVARIPSDVAFRHRVVPFALHGRRLSVAMADPFDREALEALRVLTGCRIERFHCPATNLLKATRSAYGSNVARMIADLDGDRAPGADVGEEELALQLQEMAREPSVVNLVNLILVEAIDLHASDVHVEPFEKTLKIKYRVDGILREMSPPPKRLQPAIVSRVKVMAGMNIAERFVPQDGHITFSAPKGRVDIRVSTVPTVHGECVVMRLLDRSTGLIGLESLGMGDNLLVRFSDLLQRPHGILLVTGPTGSGKTTTLYAALQRMYTPEKKIITIEDPVEYQLEGINQMPVNRKRGLDFATGLRAIVRQDPDIIMVGEIRDRETADIAIRSALTGHLVFSTLHTNDAIGAVARLTDMGVEPFLLASSLIGVLAQRLVRQICPDCVRPDRPDEHALQRIGHRPDEPGEHRFQRGLGCANCRQTGYVGRMGVFEMLRVTPAVNAAIARRASTEDIAAAAPPDHMPMREDGYRKAIRGQTTVEEVLRVTQDTQDITE